MFYSILPIVIIVASLAAVVIIVVRKFPQLTAVEVETLHEVKQARTKEQIKRQRFERNLVVFLDKLKIKLRHVAKVKQGWEAVQGKFRIAVFGLQQRYKQAVAEEAQKTKPESAGGKEKEQASRDLLQQADDAYTKGDLAEAENRYIDVIRRDMRNVEAYRGLGKVYFDMEKFREATETFNFLLKLKPDDGRSHNRLGMIAEAQGHWEEATKQFETAVKLESGSAIRYFDLGRAYVALRKPALSLRNFAKAVDIEPNNPKYLDQLLEISIMSKDAELAKATYDRLRLVNPDNQKLEEFRQRIAEIEV